MRAELWRSAFGVVLLNSFARLLGSLCRGYGHRGGRREAPQRAAVRLRLLGEGTPPQLRGARGGKHILVKSIGIP